MIHQNDMQFQQKYIEIPVGNFNINIKKVTLKCTQKCKDLGGQKETKKRTKFKNLLILISNLTINLQKSREYSIGIKEENEINGSEYRVYVEKHT